MVPTKIIVQGDPDIADLIPDFLEHRRADVQAMLQAVEAGEFQSVQAKGHSIKGVGGGYGFDAITDFGAQIEKAAITQDRQAVDDAVQALSTYLECVEVVYPD